MAEDGEKVRIEIGFDGGQIMSAHASAQEVERLERHLQVGGDGVVEVGTDDGRYFVAIRRVVYLKRFSRESKVGF
jgi:hypothetical protein